MYRIKEVADIAGISIRTLHHYDNIGLLTPTLIEENGYRKYSEHDIERLQQILLYKELGFSLQKIKEILEHPSFDRKNALLSHKQVLLKKKERLEAIIQSVDKTIMSMERGRIMPKKDMFEPFDMKKIEEHQKKHAEETKEKYGESDAYKQSQKKTSTYNEADWKRIHEEGNKNYERIVKVMHKGPQDEEVQEIVADMRQHITDNFYDCTIDIFRGLGDLYVNDPRFTKNIDKHKEGLSEFLKEAFHYYCDQEENHSK